MDSNVTASLEANEKKNKKTWEKLNQSHVKATAAKQQDKKCDL